MIGVRPSRGNLKPITRTRSSRSGPQRHRSDMERYGLAHPAAPTPFIGDCSMFHPAGMRIPTKSPGLTIGSDRRQSSISLTPGLRPAERRAVARGGVLVAAAALVAFAEEGEPLLRMLGISLPAFRAACSGAEGRT